MYIVLTGAKGTLGSQILFSLLESRWDTLTKAYLIVRKKKQVSAHARIMKMLDCDSNPPFIHKNNS